MAKIRVYELARELKMESKALLAKMKEMGIEVPGHQSTLTTAQVDKLRIQSQTSQPPKVVVRRRRKAKSEETDAESQVSSSEEMTDGASSQEAALAASPATEESSEESSKVSPPFGSSTADRTQEDGAATSDKREKGAAEASSLEAEIQIKTSGSGGGHEHAAEVHLPSASEVMGAVAGEASSSSLSKESPEESRKQKQQQMGASVSDPVHQELSAGGQHKSPDHESAAAAPAEGAEAKAVEGTSQVQNQVNMESGSGIDLRKAVSQEMMMKSAQASAAPGAEREATRSGPSPQTKVDKDVPQQPQKAAESKRRVFAGATIIRRATPEETEAIKAREEARQRTSRREDSRGVRVTGIGVSPRMGQSDGPEGSERKADARKKSVLSGHKAPRSYVSPSETTTGGGEELYEKASRWGGRAPERGRDAKRREEEEKVRVAPAAHQKKRVSMRDLLSEVVADDEVPGLAVPVRKKRMVYTPTAQQKRRDLKRRKDMKSTNITVPRAAYRVVKMEGLAITVGDLARQLSIKSGDLIKKLMGQGVMATVNQSIDFDTAALIASEFGFECKNIEKTVEDVLGLKEQDTRSVQTRAPIITVMGHVDHGKTSILDAIRQANVVGGESGGITQHIGAYTVERDGFSCTFLDTPGHAAFSAMRARGAQVTDIVVLVVAADDGVMPQTIEAISHARNAGVPIIVAVNKIDKPNLNLDRLYSELGEHGVQAEEWGGDVQFIKVSALKKEGIESLLEAIQIQAEVLELSAPFEGAAEGAVVEAHLDKGRGPIATIMVMKGCLQRGDYIVVGNRTGRVRAMTDHLGNALDQATPSTPVAIVGLTDVPMSGDPVHVVEDEKVARSVADIRRKSEELAQATTSSAASLEDLLGRVNSADIPTVNLIVKADTQGSVEAIASALNKLNSDQVRNVLVHKAVGGINESDLNLADTSSAVVLGFNVRASASANELAERRGVVVKYYSVIYDLVDTVKNLMSGELPPVETEVIQGHAEVRDAISVPRVGTVAGSSVLDGKITRNSLLRLIRDEIVIYKGKVGSLRRFKDDVKEVQNGYECGIAIEGYTDIKVGDLIEAYQIEKTAATLEFVDG